jgi:hypothetical protein
MRFRWPKRPTVCRRVVCSIGGYSEIAEAVEQAGVEILFARVQPGVLAFGADARCAPRSKTRDAIQRARSITFSGFGNRAPYPSGAVS